RLARSRRSAFFPYTTLFRSEQRGVVADVENGLHGSFSKSALIADDDRASIILQGRRENLTGRRALPAGQDDQWSRVGDPGIRIAGNDNVAIRAFGLHDGTRFQKQPRE